MRVPIAIIKITIIYTKLVTRHRWFPSHRPPSLSNRAGLCAFTDPPCKSPKFRESKAVHPRRAPSLENLQAVGAPRLEGAWCGGADTGWPPEALAAATAPQWHCPPGDSRVEKQSLLLRWGCSLDTRGALSDEMRPLLLSDFPGRLSGVLGAARQDGLPTPHCRGGLRAVPGPQSSVSGWTPRWHAAPQV